MNSTLLHPTLASLAILLGCTMPRTHVPEELRQVRMDCQIRASRLCMDLWECTENQRRRCIAAMGWSRAAGQWTRVRTSADLEREIQTLIDAQLELQQEE